MTELEDAELEVPARTLSECSGSYTEVIEAYGTSSWDSSPEECAQDAVDDCNANLADLMDAFVEDCEDFCGRQGCGYYIRGDDGSLCDWPPPLYTAKFDHPESDHAYVACAADSDPMWSVCVCSE